MFDCCIGHENVVVVVPSPAAVHQPRTYTAVITGTKEPARRSTHATHTYLVHFDGHKRTQTYKQKNRLRLSQRRELTARLMLYHDCHKY